MKVVLVENEEIEPPPGISSWTIDPSSIGMETNKSSSNLNKNNPRSIKSNPKNADGSDDEVIKETEKPSLEQCRKVPTPKQLHFFSKDAKNSGGIPKPKVKEQKESEVVPKHDPTSILQHVQESNHKHDKHTEDQYDQSVIQQPTINCNPEDHQEAQMDLDHCDQVRPEILTDESFDKSTLHNEVELKPSQEEEIDCPGQEDTSMENGRVGDGGSQFSEIGCSSNIGAFNLAGDTLEAKEIVCDDHTADIRNISDEGHESVKIWVEKATHLDVDHTPAGIIEQRLKSIFH